MACGAVQTALHCAPVHLFATNIAPCNTTRKPMEEMRTMGLPSERRAQLQRIEETDEMVRLQNAFDQALGLQRLEDFQL